MCHSTDDIGAISTKVRDEDVDSLLGQQQWRDVSGSSQGKKFFL